MTNCLKHNKDEINSLFKQAQELFDSESYEKSKVILLHLIECHICEIKKEEVYFYLGGCLVFQEKFEDGLKYLIDAERELDDEKNKLLFLEIMDFMGYCYKSMKDYDNAIDSFKKGEKYLILWEGDKYYRRIYFLLAKTNCIFYLHEYSNALREYKKIELLLPYLLADEFDKNSSIVYLHIAETIMFLDNLKVSEEYMNKININHLDYSYKHSFFRLQITLKSLQKKYQEVIQEFLLYEEFGISEYNKAIVYDWVGSAYYFLKNIKEAKIYLKKSLLHEDKTKWAHKNARELLSKYCFSEKKYALLLWCHHCFILIGLFLLYLSQRDALYNIELSVLELNYPIKDLFKIFWLIPVIVSVSISIYLKQWKYVGIIWYNKKQLKDKISFYSIYIIFFMVISTLEFFIYLK